MYQEKTMLITGASSEIGKEIATYFAKLGVNIILTYYNNKDLVNELGEELQDNYHIKVDSYYLNLCQEECIVDLYNSVKKKHKKIDYLINNAAISMDSYLFDKTKEEFMKVLETNTVGTFLMMKYFDDIIDGYIFNISSTDGIDTGNIYSVDYNASKAAINSITKTFSLASTNKIISICPNWVDTKSTRSMSEDYLKEELKRIGQKELITVSTIPRVIDELIKSDIETGSVIRIEGDEDARRIN